MQFLNQPLMDAISAQSIPQISEFSSQGLSNTAWSLSMLILSDVPVLGAIAFTALHFLLQFLAQELSTTAWAFAKLAFLHWTLFDAIA
jgi:hypothetical protein